MLRVKLHWKVGLLDWYDAGATKDGRLENFLSFETNFFDFFSKHTHLPGHRNQRRARQKVWAAFAGESFRPKDSHVCRQTRKLRLRARLFQAF